MELLADLDRRIDGDVHTDTISRMIYATDASVYQTTPLGVVRPRHREDCVAIMTFAAEHGIPLIPRAGGTSLAGQCVGAGLIVDVSRYMTKIVEINVEARTVSVQPGVILDDLNDALAPHKLFFGPDTSTSNRCMIGGMVGNNSCGTHSILYGTTRDHVIELEAVLSDGTLTRFGPVDARTLEARREARGLEGAVYRTVFDVVDKHRTLITETYPDAKIVRRNTGYPLDALAFGQPWTADGPAFNMARFLAGTEGTLALTTEIKLNLVDRPTHKILVCAHFDSLDASMRATVRAVGHKPVAVELMDDRILLATEGNIEQARNRFWVEGKPVAVLAIEFYDASMEVLEARAAALIAELKEAGLGYAFPIVRGPEIGRIWALRSAGLGLLMGMPGDVKAVTCIEDTAVAVEDLPEYVRAMAELMRKYDTQCVYYAHASVGELHLRPELNIKTREGLTKFRGITEDVAGLVKRFGGSLSGEHGDGILRGEFVEFMLGAEVFGLLKEVKAAFDPHHLLNPGKIIDAAPMDENLRVDPDSPDPTIATWFDWSADMGLLRAAEKCNGAGACRKSVGRGTMCPSYMATHEERHTTRARANVFRTLLTEQHPDQALSADELYEALDLCVSCKGCKSECPANVDMARMKAEYLQHRHDKIGLPLRSRVFGDFARLGKLASTFPGLSNWGANLGLSKKLLGVHPNRTVPAFARQTFGAWARKHTPLPGAGRKGKVVLFNDAFTDLNDPHVGIAAVEFLELAGWEVTVTQGLQSARTQISKGMLRDARKVLDAAITGLAPLVEQGLTVIGIEPSAILTFRDEAPDLVSEPLRERARAVDAHALMFEEFVAREARAGQFADVTFGGGPWTIVLHGHCHQKAICGTRATHEALGLLPGLTLKELPTGCCGMAGSFGYEAEHYEVSMQIGELVLFPALRKAADDVTVVAPGTSCRHQIHDGVDRHALHPAEVLRKAIQPP